MIDFTVNGVTVRTGAGTTTLLSTILRDELCLTGTKVGCDDGRCGTCAVLVNGRAARACRVTVGEVSGTVISESM